MLNELSDRAKNIPIDFWSYGLSLKLLFQGNSSPPDIRQQAEHLLHGYELDDDNLQKAQLEQHKIFQNFPTNPAPVAPSAPPLPAGTNPKVSPLIEPNDFGNNSLKTPFNIKTHDTFLNNRNLPPSKQRLSELLALQSQVSEADGFSAFPVLRNADTRGQITPQYEGINFFHKQQMKKAVTMYGPHLPFTREILNAMVSSIGTFIPYDWQILIKALLKPGKYLQWTMWFQDIPRGHANRNARVGAPQNQITFGMLTGTGQFDTIEAQIRCPPLLHDN